MKTFVTNIYCTCTVEHSTGIVIVSALFPRNWYKVVVPGPEKKFKTKLLLFVGLPALKSSINVNFVEQQIIHY